MPSLTWASSVNINQSIIQQQVFHKSSFIRLRRACVRIIHTYTSIRGAFSFFLPRSIYYPRTTLALSPSSNSDPGSHSGPSSPLPTTVRAFIYVARRIRHFLSSSTRVELYLPTLLGVLAVDSFCAFLQIKSKSHDGGGNRTQRTNASNIRG